MNSSKQDLRRRYWCAHVLIVVLVLAIYAPVRSYPFVNLDDDRYVVDNPEVHAGLTLDSIRWALTADAVSNWHPVTWMSHMADCQMFGENAGGHHVVNVLFHLANALLLFHIFFRMTGGLGRSAMVAVLFAVHPMHVESVAWVAERKDVLSTFFAMLAILCYVRYVERRSLFRYGWVALCLAAGLASKPMVVTLPCVLLLLDFWPLGRFRDATRRERMRCVWEKMPLLALSGATSVITILVQQGAGSVISLERYSLAARVANAIISYVRYMSKTFWPMKMSVFYPHPGNAFSLLYVGIYIIIIFIVSVYAITRRVKHAYVLVGWLLFLGVLVPTIGIFQVGLQAMADRYSYFSSIGLFVIVVWGTSDVWVWLRFPPWVLKVLSGCYVVVLVVLAMLQVQYWRDSTTLFEHALAVTSDNALAHYNLGVTLLREGRNLEASRHFEATTRIEPEDAKGHLNLGASLVALGRHRDALPHFLEALRLEPENAHGHYNLATALLALKKPEEALSHLRLAVKYEPERPEGHYNLGTALYQLGQLEAAVSEYRETIRLDPGYGNAHVNLGNALFKLKRDDEAVEQYRVVIGLEPDRADARVNLGHVLADQGKLAEAAAAFEDALRINPEDVDTRGNLKVVRDALGLGR